ncbi:MAG: 3-methyl-2-oxobutanoate dehydrogenase subunit VorB [Clostridiales bacterium]|jgi:2-oxoglutarate ferredoxin oxidoreductase subunit alpha|nr:3-methyl-2-oxobutanoate dehydrogenase subunit VorB [Clostridiales bacterium]HOB64733.1 3-methyl-2-oxobutanoate dehydrogenase subunit VorB [Clostridia bacterium]HOK81901.1 3-methyl-2-oxobutanoate dehydrogenase subunit VorB [Clostridia bacterium]HOL61562.1 3-methyl-2-oxobutanoate dehydrogenase subunit VorB [Clostridia bacterium]HPO54191.1 3-methyl-2-oxobutanoate dehydrogenase subunit VorB [Clostridia bacterium]
MKQLMKGNEAIAEAAIRGGCRAFFGYPITPQNEIPEYCSKRMPEVGGVFIQAESEVSAINMVYGAAGAGARAMTSSSSPGISLKQEGISYICGSELPCLIVNIVRAGPGLGGIQPAQSDYFQAVKGGGHGDYHMLVYGPESVQEAVDIAYDAFDKAEKYRAPVMILGDGMLGQIMEAVEIPPMKDPATFPKKDWVTDGTGIGSNRRIINSLYIEPDALETVNHRLFARYKEMAENETAFECYKTDDAEIVLVAYGTVARICKSAVNMLRANGIKAGLFRPITLYPYPYEVLAKIAAQDSVKSFLAVELSMGQMVEDVRLGVNGKKPVEFFGRTGGAVMSPEDIVKVVMQKEGR